MNNLPTEAPDPEDMFNDTRMSFADHIDELRTHLLRAIKGFVVGMVISFWLGRYVLRIIVSPVEEQLDRFEARMQEKERKESFARLKEGNVRLPPIPAKIMFDRRQLEAVIRKEKRPTPVL